MDQCLNFYMPSPLGHDGIPVTKVYWDSEEILSRVDPSVLETVVNEWPEPMEKRHSKEEFFQALGHPRPKISDKSPVYSYGRNKKHPEIFEWRDVFGAKLTMFEVNPNLIYNEGPQVIIDEGTRSIYITNLKSASSTISNILFQRPGVIKLCSTLRSPINYQTLIRISQNECGGKCEIKCDNMTAAQHRAVGRRTSAAMKTSDLPDELLDQYLVYSFGV
jgi:hypothetical protein